MSIGILDYGMANLRSVVNAFAAAGSDAAVISSPAEVERVDRLVLPGVGAFADAAETLRRTGLDSAIKRHITAGRPFLGICLGLQLLFDIGTEDGVHEGLGILSGRCVPFVPADLAGLKIPHMGWNSLDVQTRSPLLNRIATGAHVYFVHGYHVEPADSSVVATTTDYGRPFVSSVWQNNIVATQFHPEKSQLVGLTMLQNFASL